MTGRNRMRTGRNLSNKPSMDLPCSFKEYKCSFPRVEGRTFCIRHILEDKTAPYRQCNFIYPSSIKRCHRASPLTDRTEGFCYEHSVKANHARNKAMFPKKPEDTPELCLEKLSHHLIAPASSFQHSLPDPTNITSIASAALEYDNVSDEDKPFDMPGIKHLARLEDDHEMDGADSDCDPLEHAGIYTTEEASRIYIRKMEKLKEMYQNEFEKLTSILKDGRREFIQALKIEKENMKSIHSQPKPTIEDKNAYEELKYMNRYHKRYGKEEILHKQRAAKALRLSTNKQSIPVNLGKCIYNIGSWKCGEKAVPLSKHCLKHILQDSHQILFQACGATPMNGVDSCEIPIIPLSHTPTCIYHTPLPEIRPMSPLPHSPLRSDPGSSVANTDSFKVSELPPTDVMEGDR